ncbi:MAG TPA: hypothetical protein VNP92_07660 [Actinophytocola sp.]|nr:hypothetical protein [Actinophytocola sp.]
MGRTEKDITTTNEALGDLAQWLRGRPVREADVKAVWRVRPPPVTRTRWTTSRGG